MEEKKDQNKVTDAYEDFLGDISDQFSRKDEEKDFLDSIVPSSPKKDIQVNVGERVKVVRKKLSPGET